MPNLILRKSEKRKNHLDDSENATARWECAAQVIAAGFGCLGLVLAALISSFFVKATDLKGEKQPAIIVIIENILGEDEPRPTYTLLPTYTPLASSTPEPTQTQSPSETPIATLVQGAQTLTATLMPTLTSVSISTFTQTLINVIGFGINDPVCLRIVELLNETNGFDDSVLNTVITNAERGQSLESEACSTLFRNTNDQEVVIHSGQAAIGWAAFTADFYPNDGTTDRVIWMTDYDAIRIIPNNYTLASSWLAWARSQNTALIQGDLIPR